MNHTAETSEVCQALVAAGALATFGPESAIGLRDDVASLSHARSALADDTELGELPLPLPTLAHDGPEVARWLELPTGGFIDPSSAGQRAPVALGPVVRSLVDGRFLGASDGAVRQTALPGGWRVVGGTEALHNHARALVDTSDDWARLADRDFANSAPYMGTKRALLPFVMTAIEALSPPDGRFVDLMCGSGVVAGAAARRWRTLSSDSQLFCRLLSRVQGGGFSRARAADVLRRLREPMSDNLSALAVPLGQLLANEAQLLTSASDWSELATLYATFVSSTPRFPDVGSAGLWDPTSEVMARRRDNSMPYCLLTAYFTNLYFGVRQAVELDSLRYAIDQLEDEMEREWSLGALIVTASSVATTYGGHFAQPPAPPNRLANPQTTKRVLARRHISATREFEIRFLSLSAESEEIVNPVELVVGPWQTALSQVSQMADPTQGIVYLDAPYRREEYSRYYHVLETLAQYGYPSAETPARIPRKGNERFASEFFTRRQQGMTEALANSIRSILMAGYRCAWSYADRADANSLEVLEAIGPALRRVRSVSADHEFKRQGRSRREGRVREYLFLLEP